MIGQAADLTEKIDKAESERDTAKDAYERQDVVYKEQAMLILPSIILDFWGDTLRGDDNSIRIKRFISDSNVDISDIAGKFYEAVSKLYSNRTYPGLPTLKKLSIMHHLELMGKFPFVTSYLETVNTIII